MAPPSSSACCVASWARFVSRRILRATECRGVADAPDQLVERLFVAAHRQLDELTHSLTHYGAGRGRGRSVSMSGLARRAFNRKREAAAGSSRRRQKLSVDGGRGPTGLRSPWS